MRVDFKSLCVFIYLLTLESVVIFSGILMQTLISDFQSHCVPHTFGLVSQLSKPYVILSICLWTLGITRKARDRFLLVFLLSDE